MDWKPPYYDSQCEYAVKSGTPFICQHGSVTGTGHHPPTGYQHYAVLIEA